MSKIWQIEGKIPKKLDILFKDALNATLNSLSITTDILVDIQFVSSKKIRQLNKQFRSIDRVTDVLSFPYNHKNMIGSIAICLKKAKKQSKDYGHSLYREATYLFVHALLHLFNYDHTNEQQKQQMRQKEEQIMNSLNLNRKENK